MEREQALTELAAAIAEVSREAREARLARIAAALYKANRVMQISQADLVKHTGYTRETIRRHVEDERIRRGEIPPTKRYLEAQERRESRKRS